MEFITKFHKTRIAPTPSGFLHLGNVFSFALTAALAEKTGAKIVLRIDDQDAQRVNQAYIEDVFETLRFLDIPWQEGPKNAQDFAHYYSQTHRTEEYKNVLQKLRDADFVYACNCSRSQIQALGEAGYPGTCRHKNLSLDAADVAWRLKTEESPRVKVTIYNQKSRDLKLPEQMRDMIVRRKDGLPAYQLSSVIDDEMYGIDFIVRGEDLWPSTVFQLYLAQRIGAENFQKTVFFHHSLVLNERAEKLSKSAGSFSVKNMRERGWSSEEVYRQLGERLGMKNPIKHWKDLQDLDMQRFSAP